MACAGGNASVKGGGHFQHDKRAAVFLPDEEIGHKITAFLRADVFNDFDSSRAQFFRSAAGLGVGIRHAGDHPAYPRPEDGIGARRNLALMATGFQCDNQRALRRAHPVSLCICKACDFRMILPGGMMPAPGHNAAIAHMANRVLRLRDGRIVEDELNESPVAAAELDW